MIVLAVAVLGLVVCIWLMGRAEDRRAGRVVSASVPPVAVDHGRDVIGATICIHECAGVIFDACRERGICAAQTRRMALEFFERQKDGKPSDWLLDDRNQIACRDAAEAYADRIRQGVDVTG